MATLTSSRKRMPTNFSSRLVPDFRSILCISLFLSVSLSDVLKPVTEVENKVGLVVGGARGIGYACVKELLRNGAKNVSILDSKQYKGEEAARRLNEEFGAGRTLSITCDVTKPEEFEDAFRKTVADFGRLDIVVTNAAVPEIPNWESTVDSNVNGAIRGTLLGIEYMSKNQAGEGKIVVNIASVVGLRMNPIIPVYVATQHAVIGYSRSLGDSYNYEQTGVRVVALCPGWTNTSFGDCGFNEFLHNMTSEESESQGVMRFQDPENVGRGLVSIIRSAESGTIWVAEDDKPIWKVNFPSYLKPDED